MYKTRSSNGIAHPQKKMPPRPKPQFSTDFVDRDQYKLSQTEMIQKKASLQSKHRDQAIQCLEERRRKLQQGIIDDDTRKVYETALSSKNIDINPPIRKNLSQMIKYEREKQGQLSNSREKPRRQTKQDYFHGNEEDEQSQNDNGEVERQLKDTRDFIKKFQRAKKMDNIGRAVQLLTDPVEPQPINKAYKTQKVNKQSKEKPRDKSPSRNPFGNQKLLTDLKPCDTSVASSHEQALSCIEDTIKFMQQRLFSSKRIQKIKQEQIDKQLKESNISYTEEEPSFAITKPIKNNLQLSGLGYHESDSQEQCMQTIRRMNEMMEGSGHKDHKASPFKLKENVHYGNLSPKFQGLSSFQKSTGNAHIADSSAEVDFSLTMNQDELPYEGPREVVMGQDAEYEQIKKSLFDEVNKLQLQTPEPSFEQPSFQVKSHLPIDQSSIPHIRSTPTPPPKGKKINSDLMTLKSQIEGMKGSVDAIKVEPISIVRAGEVMGMDFRGSINIKKHVIQK